MFSFDVLVNDFPFDFLIVRLRAELFFYIVNQLSGLRMNCNVILMPSITVSRA